MKFTRDIHLVSLIFSEPKQRINRIILTGGDILVSEPSDTAHECSVTFGKPYVIANLNCNFTSDVIRSWTWTLRLWKVLFSQGFKEELKLHYSSMSNDVYLGRKTGPYLDL